MPALVPLLGVAVGLAILSTTFYYYALPRLHDHRPALLATQPLPVQNRPHRTTMDASLWPSGFPHDAPDEPMTVDEAHLTMQRHRECLRENCPRKAAAYQLLAAAGHLTPDAGRAR